MSLKMIKFKFHKLLTFMLFLQFITLVATLFDIPLLRQFICFLYFTFVPGFIILKLLKPNKLGIVEVILFSVGLSLAFLTIIGLLLNEIGPIIGFPQPLSLEVLLVVLNSVILVLVVLSSVKNKSSELLVDRIYKSSPSALFFMIFPILSIFGAMWVNTCENNIILLFMILAISLLFIISTFFEKLFPSRFYPLAVFTIAVALLYHSSFISNYLVSFGSDSFIEYFVFKTTENNAQWSSTFFYSWDLETGRINAMLSTTILPTIYSRLLNMNSIWIFKIIFPFLFSFVPLGLYQMWHRYTTKKFAFISAFLFMAQETFYSEMLGLNRQMIAELFFVLLLLLILDNKIGKNCQKVCFIMFSFGLITSHYGLSMIFLFFISFTLISLFIIKRASKKLTVYMAILFFIIMFGWYIFTSRSVVFDSFLKFGEHVYRQLSDFLNPTSRGEEVMRGLGLEPPPTVWNIISRAFAYSTEFFILVGFVGLLTKRVKVPIQKECFMLTLGAIGLLIALIVVPGLAETMRMARFYHILLFFLAPLCILGAKTCAQFITKQREAFLTITLLVVVLVPYFLFQTSFVYELVGTYSWSLPLSKHRMNPLRLYGCYGYTDVYSVYGAQWLSHIARVEDRRLIADIYSRTKELRIYGGAYSVNVKVLSNVTETKPGEVVYLSSLNVIEETVVKDRFQWNISQLGFLDDLNMIYSNGKSEIYEKG